MSNTEAKQGNGGTYDDIVVSIQVSGPGFAGF